MYFKKDYFSIYFKGGTQSEVPLGTNFQKKNPTSLNNISSDKPFLNTQILKIHFPFP